MPVRISYKTDASSEAWRWDWPAAPAPVKPLATAETVRGRSETPEPAAPSAGRDERA